MSTMYKIEDCQNYTISQLLPTAILDRDALKTVPFGLFHQDV